MTKGWWCSVTRPGAYLVSARLGMCPHCVQQSFIECTEEIELNFLVWVAALLPGVNSLSPARLAKAIGRSKEEAHLLLTAKVQDFPADHAFREWHADGVLGLDHYEQVGNAGP